MLCVCKEVVVVVVTRRTRRSVPFPYPFPCLPYPPMIHWSLVLDETVALHLPLPLSVLPRRVVSLPYRRATTIMPAAPATMAPAALRLTAALSSSPLPPEGAFSEVLVGTVACDVVEADPSADEVATTREMVMVFVMTVVDVTVVVVSASARAGSTTAATRLKKRILVFGWGGS
jgi:hypothetical protein